VKLGIENRKQLIVLAVLSAIGLGMLAYEFWPTSATAPTAAKAISTRAPRLMGRSRDFVGCRCWKS